MRHLFTTLRFRLILLVFLAVLPALGVILYSGLEQRRLAAEAAKKDVLNLVHHASLHEERVVEGVRQMLFTLAELPAVRQQDGAAASAIFTQIMEKQKIFSNISAINLQGIPFASALPQPPRSQLGRSHFDQALKTRDFAVGEFGIDRTSGKGTIHFGYPILDHGVAQGVISASLDLDYFNTLVSGSQLPLGSMITIIDRDGTILARHPQPEQWVGKRMPEVEIIKTVLAKGEGTAEAVGIDGVPYLFAFSPLEIGSRDLLVYAGVPFKAVYAVANRTLTRNLLALGGAALLALIAAWMLGQFFLIGRTQTLVNTSQQLAGGNLEVRSGLSYDDGEFGQLAQSFDEMAATLQQRQESLRESEEKYRTLVENIDLGITLISSDYKIIMTNAGQGKIFGKPPQEFVGKYCFQEFEKRDSICPHCPAVKAMASGKPMEVDTIGVHDDGTVHNTHVRTFPTFDSLENVTGFVKVVEDTTASRLAAAALEEERRQKEAILNNIPDIAWLKDKEGQYLSVNDPFATACGVSSQEMVGKNDLDIWPLHLAQKYRADDQEVIRTRNRKCFEEPLRNSEKGMIWIETIKTPILNDKHEVIGTTGISRDITSRRHMEEALKESETKYRLLAENARDLIWRMDLNQQITFASPAVQVLTGFTPEEFITLGLDQILTPASLQMTRENIARLQEIELREKPPLPPSVTLEIEHRRKDGATIWTEVQATILRGSQGETTGLMGVSRDITERRQVQEALRESEKRFRDITENAVEWVWETDDEGKFTHSSSVVEQVLGYKSGELMDKYFYDLFPPEERDKLRQVTEIVAKQPFRDLVSPHLHKNGKVVWVSLSGVPILDDQGKLLGYRGSGLDNTERRRWEESLEDANKKLKTLVQDADERNRAMTLLNEMSDTLQSCLTLQEALEAINYLVPKFYPADAGALYLLRDSKNLLSPVTVWGQPPPSEEMFPPEDCWAVRGGRVHRVEDPGSALLCQHVTLTSTLATGYLCVPLMAQGTSLGIFHLRFLSCATGGREAGELEAKQRLAVAIAENLSMALANLKLRESLQNQAIHDPLTGLYNRRYLEETMDRELHRANRQKTQVGVVLIDLDHFKDFNDTFGHAAGDALLSALANVITTGIRADDIACRYAGEEFLLIMPGASLETTRERADNLGQAVRNLQVKYQDQLLQSTTISLGVAIFPDHGLTAEEVIAAAHGALYRAKQAGRDRVEIARCNSPAAAAS